MPDLEAELFDAIASRHIATVLVTVDEDGIFQITKRRDAADVSKLADFLDTLADELRGNLYSLRN